MYNFKRLRADQYRYRGATHNNPLEPPESNLPCDNGKPCIYHDAYGDEAECHNLAWTELTSYGDTFKVYWCAGYDDRELMSEEDVRNV